MRTSIITAFLICFINSINVFVILTVVAFWRVDCENQRYIATLILLKGYEDSKSAARNIQMLKKILTSLYVMAFMNREGQ